MEWAKLFDSTDNFFKMSSPIWCFFLKKEHSSKLCCYTDSSSDVVKIMN